MLVPKLLSFFKVPQPRGFDYKPRYYSEQKEYIDRLKDQINPASASSDASSRAKARIQDRFNIIRSKHSVQYTGKHHAKRVLYLIIGLLVLGYLISYASGLL